MLLMRTGRLSFADIYFPEDRSNSRFSDHPVSKNGAPTLFQSIKAIRLAKQPFFRSSSAHSVSDYHFSLVRGLTMCSKRFFSTLRSRSKYSISVFWLFAHQRRVISAFFSSSIEEEGSNRLFSCLRTDTQRKKIYPNNSVDCRYKYNALIL